MQLLLASRSNGKGLVPETSEGGMSSELSVDMDGQSENNSCADLCNQSGLSGCFPLVPCSYWCYKSPGMGIGVEFKAWCNIEGSGTAWGVDKC